MSKYVAAITFICMSVVLGEINLVNNDLTAKSPSDQEDSDISSLDIVFGPGHQAEPQKLHFHLESPGNENEPQKIGFRFETEANTNKKESLDLKLLEDGRRKDKPILRTANKQPQVFQKHNQRYRIGNATNTKNFPYMAAIIINGRLWCAGSLVDENWVLTAAHCLNFVLHVSPLKSLGNFVKVRVGSARAHEGGRLIDVVGAVRHPKFEEEPVPHADVALVKLAENIPISLRARTNLIKIYEGTKEPYSMSFVTVSGWGANRVMSLSFQTNIIDVKGSDTAFRDHTPDLGFARLKVRSRQYCIDAYQLVNGFQFTNDFFCASLRNGTRDTCLFDAGAPAVQQNRLMGIMSFGPERCGHEYQPAVFIKAFYFKDFVKTTISSYKTTEELIEAMGVARPHVDLAKPEERISKSEEEIPHRELDEDNIPNEYDD